MAQKVRLEDLPHYNYTDYTLWEGDWELIRGIPYAMSPAPSWFHQSFGSDFVFIFQQALRRSKTICNCKVLYECDWIVNDDTVVRPDVMIVCGKIEGNYPTKPPQLILEILSPQSMLKDRNTKFTLYQAYGVQYYLLANVEKQQIEVFVLTNNHYEQAETINEFILTDSCTIEVDLRELFE